MNVSNPTRRVANSAKLGAECQRWYSQAVAACLARLQRSVELLQQPLLSDVQLAGLHREIDEQTVRLNTLVRHVLAAGGAALGEAQPPVALAGPISSLLDDYRALCPARPLEMRLAALPATAAFALPSVLLVLQLLLDNALRRTPGGQAVTVTSEADAETGGWIFRVRDGGAGLAPAHLAVLFEDPSQAGPAAVYGLGLSLAYAVIEALGGRIWADCEPGAGAIFSFSLPRPALLRRWTVSRPKVLVIDQEAAQSAALCAGYEEAGFEVMAAASVAAGLALVPSFAPSLVVVELSPASLAGQDCLAALRQCSSAAVIFLVPPGDRAAIPDALWQGAADCLVKPFHIRELIARTRAILRRQAARPPAGEVRPRPGLFQRPKINPMLQ